VLIGGEAGIARLRESAVVLEGCRRRSTGRARSSSSGRRCDAQAV
jgi:hypothetical protein